MNRHIIIASHSTLAAGIAETLRFFEGEGLKLTVITAYVEIINQLKIQLEMFLKTIMKMTNTLF